MWMKRKNFFSTSSGTVCLDVINQAWSPMYELFNIFDVFLPQLLQDPNPKDPLNGDAAQLLLKDSEKYKLRVREYVKKFASKDKLPQLSGKKQENGTKEVVTNGNITLPQNCKADKAEETKSVGSELSNASDYVSD